MAKERPYLFTAVVRRTVVDNIRFTVRAANPLVARAKAEKFLQQFPEESTVEGVDYAYIDNREHLENTVAELDLERN